MKQRQLFSSIRQHVKKRLNQYIDLPDIENRIVPPQLGIHSGAAGSLVLAERALEAANREAEK